MVKTKFKQNKIKPVKNGVLNYESNSYAQTTTPFNRRELERKMNRTEIISLFWGAKEILRGDFKRVDYGRIILPFVVLCRLDGVLKETKEDVLEELEKLKGEDENLINARLDEITGYEFHNKSELDFESLINEPKHIHENMMEYLSGYSPNVKEILENFKFYNVVDELEKQGLLYKLVQHFTKAPVDTKSVTLHDMGTIYEELIRKISEATNEEAGEHFTPREVIHLMVNLIFSHDEELLQKQGLSRSIYDPAAGTGGMLAVAYDYIKDKNKNVDVKLFGQELLPYAYAICKSDMMIKNLELDNIKYGNSLTDQDGFQDKKFHYMLSNPPFGVDWGKYSPQIYDEAEKGHDGKFGAGTPRKSDGSLLFLMHMISKMKSPEEGGGRISIVLNGSPLFTGEAGSGESDIRKWIIKNDMLEAIIAMPDQLFYNTGIFTYIWVVTNKKPDERKGKIQLINTTSDKFYVKMKSSLGMKRNLIEEDEEKNLHQITEITNLFKDFKEGEYSKIFENDYFGYTRITVELPLKRNFQVNDERIQNLKDNVSFNKLHLDKETEKLPSQNQILKTLEKMPTRLYKDHSEFSNDLKQIFVENDVKLTIPLQKIIENTLSERDETAEPQYEKEGDEHPMADSELRDFENIPLSQNVEEYFENEVVKYLPDAWIDESRTKIGYEIPFRRQFYKFNTPLALKKIDGEIKKLHENISTDLEELMDE